MTKVLLSLFAFLFTFAISAQTVTNLNDSGPGSLRQEILDASSGDTIRFSPNLLANGSDTLKLFFPISFVNGVVIEGIIIGADTLYLSGQDSTQIFYMDLSSNPNESVYLRDLVFINGKNTAHGGALYANGLDTLVMENCMFRSNRTTGAYSGGAAYIESSNFYMNSVVFVHNRTDTIGNDTTTRRAGALFSRDSDGNFDACIFKENYTTLSSGGLLFHNGKINCVNSIFRSNRCTSNPGGLSSYGGAVTISNSEVLIDGCSFEDNFMKKSGGALAIATCSTSVVVANSTFANNTSLVNGGGMSAAFCGTPLEIINCVFLYNHAKHGGAISGQFADFNIRGSSFHHNEAQSAGGVSVNGTLSVENSTFLENDGNSWGAELYHSGDVLTVKNSTFYNWIVQDELVYSRAQNAINLTGNLFVFASSDAYDLRNAVVTSEWNVYLENPSFSTSSDYVNSSASSVDLGPLANNGGTTPTMLPGPNSIVLNAGDSTDFSPAQNGPIFGRRDIGAAERAIVVYDSTLACSSVNWWGSVYSQSGTYTDTAFNANSIDSIGVLVLFNQDTSIVNLNGILIAQEQDSATSYQWFNCGTGSIVPSATDFTFLPTTNGSYAVILTNGTCIDTSACMVYNEVSLREKYRDQNLLFYPNPTTGQLTLRTHGELPKEVVVLDLQGRRVSEMEITSNTLQLPNLRPGVYVLQWVLEEGAVQVDRVVVR